MPGDELHEEATGPAQAATGARRERSGPRHAAPKKPFLTRLHVPAGKAVAMAAMPSAVLMSMGITPQLAYAKPLPKNPFREGPCVSQEDKTEEEAEAEARKEAEAEAEAARKAEEARERAEAEKQAQQEQEQEAAEDENSSGAEGSSDGSTGTATGGSGGTGSGDTSPEPEPSPSQEDGSGGLLGGVGDAVGDLLGGGERQQESTPEPEPSDTADTAAQDSATDSARDAAEEAEKGLEDTVDKVEEGVDGATGDLPVPDPSAEEPEEDPAAEGSQESDATEPVTGADGKKDFPCVEEKKVAGEGEQTPVTLPNQPWTLEASSLGLHGLDYEGVFNVRTADGSTKQVLKFTAKSVDIGDLHQIVDGADGVRYHVEAAPGSNSTIRNGQVTMYTERLEGKLFGLIPIVFDPEHQPPLNLPEVYFTDVTVKQAGQFGGDLTVPGLHSSITTG